jgi:hypothetical protein
MLERVAFTVAPLRVVCTALFVWLTATLAYVTSAPPPPRNDSAMRAMSVCARS